MNLEQKTVLFVDDDADVRKTAELLLQKRGYLYAGAANPEEALSALVANPVNVVLLDLNFTKAQTSGQEGLACLRDILRHDPKAAVIVVTGHSGLSIAVQALRNGARDFIMKPWNNERLIEAIEQASRGRTDADDSAIDPSVIVGSSEATRRTVATIDRCAPLTVATLFRGDPGTGKTLAALAMHRQSGRIVLKHIEASALSPTDLDDTPNTTLIIENVDRLPEQLSPTLFSWLSRSQRSNSRLIATTTRPTSDLGLDRGLTYAIRTVEVTLPPLQLRTEDIVPIAEHFVRVACQQQGFATKRLTTDAQAALSERAWPDNVHALRHIIERAVILHDGQQISAVELALDSDDAPGEAATKPKLADSEKVIIEQALKRHNFNVSAAADELGLTRPSLYRRMSKHGL